MGCKMRILGPEGGRVSPLQVAPVVWKKEVLVTGNGSLHLEQFREKLYLPSPNSLYLGLPDLRAPPGVNGKNEHPWLATCCEQ